MSQDAPGKYTPLRRYLEDLPNSEPQLCGFDEIEVIIGFSLPPSARRHLAWWANDKTHVQAVEWMLAGWRAKDVDLTLERLTFVWGGVPEWA